MYLEEKIAALQQGMMGWMAYVFPLLLFCGVAFVVSNKGNRIAYIKTVAGVVLLVQCCVLFELIDEKRRICRKGNCGQTGAGNR